MGKVVWRTCYHCGSKFQAEAETYKKHPLSVYCPNCMMNKDGNEKGKGMGVRRGT